MKKIIFIVGLLCFLVSNMSYALITVNKARGGTNGYYTTRETHDGGSHSLSCYDPGNETCAWETKPSLQTSNKEYDIDVLTADVETYISNGQTSGSFTLDGELIVSWATLPQDEYVMTIDEITE